MWNLWKRTARGQCKKQALEEPDTASFSRRTDTHTELQGPDP